MSNDLTSALLDWPIEFGEWALRETVGIRCLRRIKMFRACAPQSSYGNGGGDLKTEFLFVELQLDLRAVNDFSTDSGPHATHGVGAARLVRGPVKQRLASPPIRRSTKNFLDAI